MSNQDGKQTESQAILYMEGHQSEGRTLLQFLEMELSEVMSVKRGDDRDVSYA